jgi:hypothetical protein
MARAVAHLSAQEITRKMQEVKPNPAAALATAAIATG